MDIDDFRKIIKAREPITVGSEAHTILVKYSNEALRITAKLNGVYHEPDEVRGLFSQLTGEEVDESFFMFPPFYTDFGKNIRVGKNVFFNTGCTFQDCGGITICDDVQIGQNVVLCTLNHGIEPDKRQTIYPAPICIGKNVWIGANATVLPGVTVGDNAIIAAGSVVHRDVQPNSVVAGVPAELKKKID